MQFDNSAAIWVQLVHEFSRRIVVGVWAPGARIAGVRELAAELGVNPNTAQRALAELERDGLCRSERTTGRFVTSDQARIDALRSQLAGSAADDYIARAQGFGMDRDQARQLIEERWNHHDHHTHRPTEGEGR